ncbi:hypothetical protein TWF281_005126 [Arthrobotrys megalospora]
MDPIIEEDEPIERAQIVLPKSRHRPRTPVSSSSSRKASAKSSTTGSETPSAPAELSPKPQRRIFDAYAFTPSQQIPRDKLTDQPPAVLWPPPKVEQCNYVSCQPELNEQYFAGHQGRPGLSKAQSTVGVDVEAELLKLIPKKESRTSGLLRSVSLKLTEPPSPTTSSTAEKEDSIPDSLSLGSSRRTSARRAMLRTKTLPIENHTDEKISLIAAGIKIPTNLGQMGLLKPIPKPYETRLCSGCHRYITLTKTQYVCNDVGCNNRMCDRCYHMWLDAKWEGRGIVTPEKLQKAHTAAEFRERYAKGMLQKEVIPRSEKLRYIGEASAGAAGHSFTDDYNNEHKTGRKTDPSRFTNFNLEPLKEFFGKEEVEMTLLKSSETKESCITAEVGPGPLASAHVDNIESFNGAGVWGWDYASGKRDAAAAGRTVPALPQLDYQPPTFAAPPSPSTSSLTIISASETVIGRADTQRSSSPPWTIWTLNSSSDSEHLH